MKLFREKETVDQLMPGLGNSKNPKKTHLQGEVSLYQTADIQSDLHGANAINKF